jgi:hypothetical protein
MITVGQDVIKKMGNNRLHDKTLKPKTDKNNLTGINKEERYF